MKLDKKILGLTLAVLLAIAGYLGWQKYRSPSTVAAAPITPQSAPRKEPDVLRFEANAPQLEFIQVKPVEAFPEPLVESLNARVAYNDNATARVFSPIAGRVVKIAVEAGQTVNAGDELLHINSPDFSQAAADKDKAEADVVRKLEVYERAKSLYQAKGMARKDMESAEADWRQAEAEAQRARARLKNLHASSASPEGNFVLRASVAGVVSERHVNTGSEVRPDATDPLFVITDPQHLWVLVDLPERQLDKVKVGQPISVEVDAFPGEVFLGQVAVISETLDSVTRRVQVRCDVNNDARRLKPEMFARVTPIADTGSSLPRVPNSALFTQGLYPFLFVEKSPGVLERRKVVLAMQGRDFTYVREGIKVGERVVVSGALLLNSELAGND